MHVYQYYDRSLYKNILVYKLSVCFLVIVGMFLGLVQISVAATAVYGGTGGVAFTDKVAQTQVLTGIEVRTNWWVTEIQGLTNTKDLDEHGGASGKQTVITWPGNQYLVRVYGTYGAYVGKISFVTNTSKVFGPYGSGDSSASPHSFNITVPKGNQIVGFRGRASSYINAIGVVYRPLKNQPPSVHGGADLTVTLAQPVPDLLETALSELPVTITNIGTKAAVGPIKFTLPLPANIQTMIKFSRNLEALVCIREERTLNCTYSKSLASKASITVRLPIAPIKGTLGSKIGAFVVQVNPVSGETNTANNRSVALTTKIGVKALKLVGLKNPNYSKLLLNAKTIPQYKLPLTNLLAPHYLFKPDTKSVKNTDVYKLNINEIQTHILPPGFPATDVYAYGDCDCLDTHSYPSHTIIGHSTMPGLNSFKQGKPVQIQFTDTRDPKGADGKPAKHLLPVDSSIHGANSGEPEIRSVVHLHGFKKVHENSDGYPESWGSPTQQSGDEFNASEQDLRKGHAVHYNPVHPYDQANGQESGLFWFHDHSLGITRLNVYAGLAGLYVLRDSNERTMIQNNSLPHGAFEVPLVLQDRMFHPDGSLAYPDTVPPDQLPDPKLDPPPVLPKPTMMPEFFGDVMLVNGVAWPYLDVEPRRYRFRMLNGSNARFYTLTLSNNASFQILGTEGGFLNAPVTVKSLTIAPGERYDLVIDFSTMRGKEILLKNSAKTPFPGKPNEETITIGVDDQIMQFRVNQPLSAAPNKSLPKKLRPADVVMIEPVPLRRQVLLAEIQDSDGRVMPMLGTVSQGVLGWADTLTETPKHNTVETWEIFNTTGDAHPIHLHGGHFQIEDRRAFSATTTTNNALTNITLKRPVPALPQEQTWKDTVITYPGEITRINVRFENAGLFVWHCHILEHEDHDMMRPLLVQ